MGVDLEDGTIPLAIAMPLFLEKEVPLWGAWNSCAENWDSMCPYILGSPHGRRSSLFVNQESGQAMKKSGRRLSLLECLGLAMSSHG